MSDNLVSLKAAKAVVDSLSVALEQKRDEVDRLTEQLELTLMELKERNMIGKAIDSRVSDCQYKRETARNVLKKMIDQKQQEINGLQNLLSLLPEDLPPDADETLWKILMKL